MAGVPFSLRLDPVTLQRLQEGARSAQRPVAGFAADLIRAGLTGEAPPRAADDSHPLVVHVLAMFARMEGFDVASQRESALILARVAAVGGSPAVGAVKELRSIFAEINRLTDGESFGDMGEDER